RPRSEGLAGSQPRRVQRAAHADRARPRRRALHRALGRALHRRPRRVIRGGATISHATAADVPAIVGLIGRVYAEYGFVYDPAIEIPDLLDFDAHYVPPRGAFFVARGVDTIVGSVGVERLDALTA